MEKKFLIMILGLFVLGFFLFGCASQSSQGTQSDTNKTNNTAMTCEEYCPLQPHVQCVGTLAISGAYPDCVCSYTCETVQTQQGDEQNATQQPATPAPMSIDILNFKFTPDIIEIAVGVDITWLNKDSAMHIVVADDGSFDSSYLTAGQTFSHTFMTAGTYTYHCGIHQTMKGTIIVK